MFCSRWFRLLVISAVFIIVIYDSEDNNKTDKVLNKYIIYLFIYGMSRALKLEIFSLYHWIPNTWIQACHHHIRSLSINSPHYVASHIYYRQPVRFLCSSAPALSSPFFIQYTNFGSRPFRCSAPAIRNTIPLEIRSLSTIDAFKRNLKTHICLGHLLPRIRFILRRVHHNTQLLLN